MERFDFIVPSGYFCVTGYHLRHARLHGETLPFDWLDGVTPELFAGFLESRFRDFLELPQLIPEGKKEEGDGHYRFRMPSGVVFVHDFARPDPAEEFAGVKQKYDRRIKRLFDKAAKARSILFVHCGRKEADAVSLQNIYKRLQALFPDKRVKFLYVRLIDGKKGFDYVSRSPEIDVVDMEFGTNSDPKQFWIGNTGVFNCMLSAYRLTFAARIRFWINRQKRKFSKNYDRM